MINKVEICGVNTAKLPVLSSKEKEELFVKIKNGDNEAREKFIQGNLRLVLSVIQKFVECESESDILLPFVVLLLLFKEDILGLLGG